MNKHKQKRIDRNEQRCDGGWNAWEEKHDKVKLQGKQYKRSPHYRMGYNAVINK